MPVVSPRKLSARFAFLGFFLTGERALIEAIIEGHDDGGHKASSACSGVMMSGDPLDVLLNTNEPSSTGGSEKLALHDGNSGFYHISGRVVR